MIPTSKHISTLTVFPLHTHGFYLIPNHAKKLLWCLITGSILVMKKPITHTETIFDSKSITHTHSHLYLVDHHYLHLTTWGKNIFFSRILTWDASTHPWVPGNLRSQISWPLSMWSHVCLSVRTACSRTGSLSDGNSKEKDPTSKGVRRDQVI